MDDGMTHVERALVKLFIYLAGKLLINISTPIITLNSNKTLKH